MQTEPIIVRETRLRQMVELAGQIRNVGKTIGEANIGVVTGNATLAYPLGECAAPLINRGHHLIIDNEGNPASYTGPISGEGVVEIAAFSRGGRGRDAALVLGGKLPNTMKGTWRVKRGAVMLAKPEGVDAMAGTIHVGGDGATDALVLQASEQIGDEATCSLACLAARWRHARPGRLSRNGPPPRHGPPVHREYVGPAANRHADGPQS